MAVMAICIAALSCQKFGQESTSGEALNDLKGDNVLTALCYETLPVVISANRTLDPDSAYLISGCVRITNGAVLTAPAGTVFLGDHNAITKGLLVVERGSQLVASGTVNNPVVFTSFQAAGSRQPGDWKGIAILGQADNNSASPSSKVLNIPKSCGTLVAGAISGVVDDTQNSATLTYVRIEYAGFMDTGEGDPASLLLAGVGSGTTIDHVQISESANDGVVIRGGLVNAKHILSYKTEHTDFRVTNGYIGNAQYWAALKANATATTVTAPYGLDISNDPLANNSNTPLTNPTFSNLTFLGGGYCANSDPNFENAVVIQNNGNARIYNSVIAGYPEYGLSLLGANVVVKTAAGTNPLEFDFNSFEDVNGIPDPYFTDFPAWTGGCGLNMTEWITGTAGSTCEEGSNQFGVSPLGYNMGSLCGDLCTSFPSFALGTTALDPTVFTSLPGFFTTPTERGAFGSTSWVSSGWANFCQTDYCL